MSESSYRSNTGLVVVAILVLYVVSIFMAEPAAAEFDAGELRPSDIGITTN